MANSDCFHRSLLIPFRGACPTNGVVSIEARIEPPVDVPVGEQ